MLSQFILALAYGASVYSTLADTGADTSCDGPLMQAPLFAANKEEGA